MKIMKKGKILSFRRNDNQCVMKKSTPSVFLLNWLILTVFDTLILRLQSPLLG